MKKEFHFKLMFTVDEDHPLYEYSNREIVAELAILLMNVTSIDPMLGYECEVMK
jgi:hypothetical protein